MRDRMQLTLTVALLLRVAISGCAAPGSGPASSADEHGAKSTPRTLIAAIKTEPTHLAARSPVPGGVSQSLVRALFNAEPTDVDARDTSQPMLAEALPRLKGTDGFYLRPGAGRFNPELKTNASSEFEAELGALASVWRQAGIDVEEAVNPTALSQDSNARSLFRSMFTNSTGVTTETPPNFTRRYAWVHPEYDRLTHALQSTLDPQQRVASMAQMVTIYTDDGGDTWRSWAAISRR